MLSSVGRCCIGGAFPFPLPLVVAAEEESALDLPPEGGEGAVVDPPMMAIRECSLIP